MPEDSSKSHAKPEIWSLEEVLERIARGTLRAPRFQRGYLWRPDQMLELFDSIERGYPIGSLIIWDGRQELPSLDRVGDIQVGQDPSHGSALYLIDGYQRIATLLGCLYRPEDAPRSASQRDWMWRIFRVLGERDADVPRYVHWKSEDLPPPHYLPMRSVLKTVSFLEFVRRLDSEVNDPVRRESFLEEARDVTQQLKNYQVAVVRVLSDSAAQAVEVFTLINSRGMALSPDDLDHARLRVTETDTETRDERTDP